MAQQINGKQLILRNNYDTYDHWRSYALTHGVNVDFSYGNQCWDICCLLWIQYGLWLYTGNGMAYGCYAIERNRNAVFPFSKVERKIDIKRGDCLVFAPSGLNYTGHICFADENYNGSNTLPCLGQNQGQGNGYGVPSNIANMNLTRFLGAFRNHNWIVPEPAPVIKAKRSESKFPWAIYARKFRGL
jgi:CHAP domain.